MTGDSFGGFSLLCTVQSSKHDQFQTNKAARYDTKVAYGFLFIHNGTEKKSLETLF